jgi:hypothetical protein
VQGRERVALLKSGRAEDDLTVVGQVGGLNGVYYRQRARVFRSQQMFERWRQSGPSALDTFRPGGSRVKHETNSSKSVAFVSRLAFKT